METEAPSFVDLAAPTVDAAIASGATKATYAGSGAAVTSWFLSSEFGVVCGILLGAIGLIFQIAFSLREDRRKQALYSEQMRALRNATARQEWRP